MKRRAHIAVWLASGIVVAVLSSHGYAFVVAARTPGPRHQVDLIGIDGPINPAAADFIDDALKRAGTDGADALVIELDTPGGLLTSAQQIVKSLLNSAVPVIVYVAPAGSSAASAGTFITEAANLAAMAPGTTIGAAHPVEMTGGNVEGALGTKIENYTASFARTGRSRSSAAATSSGWKTRSGKARR